MKKVSLIVTTYKGDNPSYVAECFNSIAKELEITQCMEVIVVCDGPLTKDLSELVKKYPQFYTLRQKHNIGRARARNSGFDIATGYYIAVIDSDDLIIPGRINTQRRFLDENRTIGLVGSLTEEFERLDNGKEIKRLRICPEKPEDLYRAHKFRCRLSNPTIMFRKELYTNFGGYRDLRLTAEDHDLFVNWMHHGVKFYCLQTPLIRFRVTPEQRLRRSGWKTFLNDINLRNMQLKLKYINIFEYIFFLAIFAVFRLMPSSLKRVYYHYSRDKLDVS